MYLSYEFPLKITTLTTVYIAIDISACGGSIPVVSAVNILTPLAGNIP